MQKTTYVISEIIINTNKATPNKTIIVSIIYFLQI